MRELCKYDNLSDEAKKCVDALGIADDEEKIYVLIKYNIGTNKRALREVIENIEEEWGLKGD